MREAAILVDREGAVREVSPAFEALSGFTAEEVVGLPLADLYASASTDLPETPWPAGHASMLTDGILGRCTRYRKRSGGSFWGESYDMPLLDANGAAFGHCRVLRDVSERVRRANGLMALISFVADQGIHRHHDMTALLDMGCAYFDFEIGILCREEKDADVVEAVSRACGLASVGERLEGESRLRSLVPDDDGVAMIERIGRTASRSHPLYLETGLESWAVCPWQGEDRRHGRLYFAVRRPRERGLDRRERQVLHFIARWTALRKDIDLARQRYDEASACLLASEERYRELYEKTPAMLHSVDGDGYLANVSDRWLSTLGYERGEVIGRRSTDFLTEESKRRAIEVVWPAYRASGYCDREAYQFVTKSGEIRDVELSAISQYDEDGQFFRSLAVLLDVTERERLDRALEDKTRALERSNADLSRFAEIAAHDLQEPLRRVVAYSQMLVEDFSRDLPPEAMAIARIVESGGQRLRRLIGDLQIYVRLNEQLDRMFEPVDMGAILDHALYELKGEIEAKGACIEVPNLPLVWGRAPLLKMVFYHLVGNAIEHGGAQSPPIVISVEDDGDVWRFAITDRGVGVEPRHADRIFEIFQRLGSRDGREGSGSGLAICRLIVQRCGGEIWLDRSYKDGARFLFTLPKWRSKSAPPPAQESAAAE